MAMRRRSPPPLLALLATALCFPCLCAYVWAEIDVKSDVTWFPKNEGTWSYAAELAASRYVVAQGNYASGFSSNSPNDFQRGSTLVFMAPARIPGVSVRVSAFEWSTAFAHNDTVWVRDLVGSAWVERETTAHASWRIDRVLLTRARTRSSADGALSWAVFVGGVDRSVVQVFEATSVKDSWPLMQELSPPGAGLSFGASMVAFDQYVAIGEPLAPFGGLVHVYERRTDGGAGGAWQLVAQVRAPRELSENARFGNSLAWNKYFLAIGAPSHDHERGAVVLYSMGTDGDDGGTLTLREELVLPGTRSSRLGTSLAVDGYADAGNSTTTAASYFARDASAGAATVVNMLAGAPGAAYVQLYACAVTTANVTCSHAARLLGRVDGDDIGASVAYPPQRILAGAPKGPNRTFNSNGLLYSLAYCYHGHARVRDDDIPVCAPCPADCDETGGFSEGCCGTLFSFRVTYFFFMVALVGLCLLTCCCKTVPRALFEGVLRGLAYVFFRPAIVHYRNTGSLPPGPWQRVQVFLLGRRLEPQFMMDDVMFQLGAGGGANLHHMPAPPRREIEVVDSAVDTDTHHVDVVHKKVERSYVLCRRCRTNEINALLLPCAHEGFCATCAAELQRCPLCERAVERFIRVYPI